MKVVYPDLQDFLLVEIINATDKLVETVKTYNVKRILIDSSKTAVPAGNAEGREISLTLALGLMKTHVQKIARVESFSADVEATVQSHISYINQTIYIPFLFKNFTDKAEALEWLKR
ncbi:hypothetical protein [Botryobacter ruber]|uniref:hypothetical protein n=1 Tax=Botryobacter ruber TaxID=2171629 RepID=UPI000FEC369B|nr:hypothetical protein [Botryobacter ruber]